MSLYLKYRPIDFSTIVNQKHIIDILNIQVNKWETNNNYIFFGSRWTWKTTTARILAKAVNCLNLKGSNPCNECINCQSIIRWQSLDLVEIDAASHTNVENIREEIIEKSPYPPSMLKKKVYIIDEVHMLSKSSFNALLKIMEEPPSYLMFILATTDINKIPETVVSRCQIFNFKKLSKEDIVWRLRYIADIEKIEYDINSLDLIAKISDWAMRDSIKYLEQVSVLWKVSEDNVSKFLWVAPDKVVEWFVELFRKSNVDDIFQYINDIDNKWIDLHMFTKEVLIYIDLHFSEDIQFYLKLSELFKDIFLWIKNFPYPLIAYKTNIYKFFFSNNNIDHDIKKNISENEKSKISENKWIKSDYEINKISQNSYEDIMNKVVENIDKIPIKTALSRYSNIDNIDWNNITLIVINELQYKTLIKDDVIKYIEKKFQEIIWNNDIKVLIKYISKEEYMKIQLW